MMKIKGQEYPVSMFKIIIHDEILDRLEWIRDNLKLKNNVEAFAACTNSVYQQLHTLEEYYKKGIENIELKPFVGQTEAEQSCGKFDDLSEDVNIESLENTVEDKKDDL